MTESLKQLIALQHEAVWWYGVAAGRATFRERGQAARQDHIRARDKLLAIADNRRVGPPAPQAGYASPKPDAPNGEIVRHSQDVENRIAAACLDLLGTIDTNDSLRKDVVTWVSQAAVAAHAWGAPVDAFPGLD